MVTDCIPQLSFKFDKLVTVNFDAEHASSDGGAVLLKAVDRRVGVTETVVRCLRWKGWMRPLSKIRSKHRYPKRMLSW
jgi:hypothetical protein